MESLSRPYGISVLICTYNGAARLMPTLEHLAKQIIASTISWEIILVDNNSNDDTLVHSIAQWERCGAPAPLHPLSQPKPGKQFALEMAYNAAQYEFMCIVDDDNWLAPDYLQRGYNTISSDGSIGLLGGSNTGAFERTPPAWFTDFQSSYAVGKPVSYSQQSKRTFVPGEVTTGVLWGAGLFVRHAIWRKLQAVKFKSLFTGRQGTKQLTAGEDDELCYLAKLLGYKLWYDEELRCVHYMTSGRLTETYLKRLCYASPRAYPGLSAYQKALSSNGSKYYSIIPWLKDWAYLFIWSVRDMVSWDYVASYFRADLPTRIFVNQRFLTWYNFTFRFRTARRNFLEVMDFSERVRQKFLTVG